MEIDSIKEYINKEMSLFKIKPYSKSYKYLVDAIYICILDEDAIENIAKNVYPKIAKKYELNSIYKVKWNLENAIDTIYCDTKSDIICDYFKIDIYQKITVKLFIYTIITKYFNLIQ